MRAFTSKIVSPQYAVWRDTAVFRLGSVVYSRNDLDKMGLGLHVVSIWRLAAAIEAHGLTMDRIYKMGLTGFYSYEGVGDITALVMSHILAEQGFDVFKWIDAKGNTFKGAIANAKAKPKARIPGRGRRTKTR